MRMRTFVGALALVVGVLFFASFLSAGTETCFSKGEKTEGLNKICYYNCPSGEAAITIKSTQLCPLSIKR
jgi:hypothetical protein